MTEWDRYERPTSNRHKPRSDSDHTLGQLMVENINHRRRLDVIETRLEVLESATKKQLSTEASSESDTGRTILFSNVRKGIITIAVIVAAVVSAIKELGLLK